MDSNKRNFDKEAATWENPPRIKLANDVAGAMLKQLRLSKDMDVLDFGCGTGLIALQLAPHVNSVTGADTSKGMLEVFQSNARDRSLNNITFLHLDLNNKTSLVEKYHLVVSSMTLHHVQDTKQIIQELAGAVLQGGYLAIADLDPEKGAFHSNHDGVFHNGFDRDTLRSIFASAGLDDIHDMTAAEMTKPAQDGIMKAFTIFLMTGRKKFANK